MLFYTRIVFRILASRKFTGKTSPREIGEENDVSLDE